MKMASVSKPAALARRTMSGLERPEYVLSKPKLVLLFRWASMVSLTRRRASLCFVGLFQSPSPFATLSAL